MSRKDEWTAEWTIKKVQGHSEAISTELITGNAFKIRTKKSNGLNSYFIC